MLLAPFSRPFPNAYVFMHFGRALAPFGLPRGSFLAPFWALWLTFRLRVDPFNAKSCSDTGAYLFWITVTKWYRFVIDFLHRFGIMLEAFLIQFHICSTSMFAWSLGCAVAGTRLCRAKDNFTILYNSTVRHYFGI